jgi:D-amino peptidase
MKFYLSCDMEGIAGVVDWDQVDPSSSDFPETRRRFTKDVAVAAQALLDFGADRVVISDAHATMRCLELEEIPRGCEVVQGFIREFSMVSCIEQGFDGAIFLGYHARRGTKKAIMDHSYSASTIREIRINGEPMGEFGINALLAGHYGVPVIMVTGDQAACKEAKSLVPDIETVVTKKAESRHGAISRLPEDVREEISRKAVRAADKASSIKPLKPKKVNRLDLELTSTEFADVSSLIPGVKRTEDCSVTARSSGGYPELFRLMMTVLMVCWSAKKL